MRLIYAVTLAGMFVTAQAQAQTVIINRINNAATSGDKVQHISINFQLSMPTPAMTSTSEWTKAIANASQSLYDIVNHECEVLTKTLKGNCRLIQINTGGNIGNRPNSGFPFNGDTAFINVNANATFEIEPKVPSPADSPQQ